MQITKSQLNYKPVQLILPMDYEHIIDKHDPVVSFLEVVGGLRLEKFINTSNVGRQDYNPEMMLHLVLFGFMEGIAHFVLWKKHVVPIFVLCISQKERDRVLWHSSDSLIKN